MVSGIAIQTDMEFKMLTSLNYDELNANGNVVNYLIGLSRSYAFTMLATMLCVNQMNLAVGYLIDF